MYDDEMIFIDKTYEDMVQLMEIAIQDLPKQTKNAAIELLEKKIRIESIRAELDLMSISAELDAVLVKKNRGNLKTIINNNKKDS